MKLWSVLNLPWAATGTFSRALALIAVFVMASVIGPMFAVANEPHWLKICIFLWGVAIGAVWLLVMPHAVSLARDAHWLRLPRIVRYADASLLLHTVLMVVLPAIVLGRLTGSGTGLLLAIFATVACGGLIWQLVPYRVASVLPLGLLLAGQVHLVTRLGAWFPDTLILLGAIATLLVCLLGWRWFALTRGRATTDGALGPPLFMAWGNRGVMGFLDRSQTQPGGALTLFPGGWFQSRPNLADVDRGHPVRAIRIALGRVLMPRTFASRLRQALPLLVLLCIVIAWRQFSGSGLTHDLGQLFSSNQTPVGIVMSLAVVGVLPQRIGMLLQNGLSADSPQLSLLALLPGLGSGAAQKRAVLSAARGQILRWLVPACLFAVAAVSFMGAPVVTDAFIICVALAGAGWSWAVVLQCLGGKPISPGWNGGIWFAFMLLLTATLVLGIPVDRHGQLVAGAGTGQIVMLLIWASWIMACAVLSWRGWRVLQQRPHPFLGH